MRITALNTLETSGVVKTGQQLSWSEESSHLETGQTVACSQGVGKLGSLGGRQR